MGGPILSVSQEGGGGDRGFLEVKLQAPGLERHGPLDLGAKSSFLASKQEGGRVEGGKGEVGQGGGRKIEWVNGAASTTFTEAVSR